MSAVPTPTDDEVREPELLSEFLDRGGDLASVPGIENYARVIVGAWRSPRIPDDEREQMAAFFLDRAERMDTGLPVPDEHGNPIIPRPSTIQHFAWLAQGLSDRDVAERFEAALPADLRDQARAVGDDEGGTP